MNITDDHVRTVRALILDVDEFDRRAARLEQDHDTEGYQAMLAGTIYQLAWRTFGESEHRQRDVIRWVSRLRARDAERDIDDLNPVAAEQLLVQVLGQPSRYAEFDEDTRAVTQYVVLTSLYEDLALTEDELDALLVEAREAAAQAI